MASLNDISLTQSQYTSNPSPARHPVRSPSLAHSQQQASDSYLQCMFCDQDESFPDMICTALYSKHSSSLKFFYTRDIDDILDEAPTPARVKFLEDNICDEADEFLRREYGLDEWGKKIRSLSEYYKYHRDIPRFYGLPVEITMGRYYERRRDYDYKRIRKLLKQEQNISIGEELSDFSESYHSSYVKKSTYSLMLEDLKKSFQRHQEEERHKRKQQQQQQQQQMQNTTSKVPIISKKNIGTTIKKQYSMGEKKESSVDRRLETPTDSEQTPPISESVALLQIYDKLNDVLHTGSSDKLDMPSYLFSSNCRNFENWMKTLNTKKIIKKRVDSHANPDNGAIAVRMTLPSSPNKKGVETAFQPNFLKKKPIIQKSLERMPAAPAGSCATTSKKRKLSIKERNNFYNTLVGQNSTASASKSLTKPSILLGPEISLNNNPRYAHLAPDSVDPKKKVIQQQIASRNSTVLNHNQLHPLTLLNLNANKMHQIMRPILKGVDFGKGMSKTGRTRWDRQKSVEKIEKIYGVHQEVNQIVIGSSHSTTARPVLARRSNSIDKVILKHDTITSTTMGTFQRSSSRHQVRRSTPSLPKNNNILVSRDRVQSATRANSTARPPSSESRNREPAASGVVVETVVSLKKKSQSVGSIRIGIGQLLLKREAEVHQQGSSKPILSGMKKVKAEQIYEKIKNI